MRVVIAFGQLLILLALLVLGFGVWLWLNGKETLAAAEIWTGWHLTSWIGFQKLVESWLGGPPVWNDVVVPFMSKPVWEVDLWLFLGLMVLGGIFVAIGRRRRKNTIFQ